MAAAPDTSPLITGRFPLPVRVVAGALTPTLALAGYSLIGGRGVWTADGDQAVDTAKEVVLCRVVDAADGQTKFVFFEVSYSIFCTGDGEGPAGYIDGIDAFGVRLWITPDTLQISKDHRKGALKAIQAVLKKDDKSLMWFTNKKHVSRHAKLPVKRPAGDEKKNPAKIKPAAELMTPGNVGADPEGEPGEPASEDVSKGLAAITIIDTKK